MIVGVADTHCAVWYLSNDPRLSKRARAEVEAAASAGKEIAVSSITLAELVYLIDKGRLDSEIFDLLQEALAGDGVLVEIPVDHNVARAMQQVSRSQVPDFPDRIIAATAVHLGVPVISRDGKIRASSVRTIW